MDDKALFDMISQITQDRIPFNKVLGITLEAINPDGVVIKFDMRPELIGNFVRGTLHGGVISSVLDVVGGITAFVGVMQDIDSEERLEKMREKFARLGTIDLRIDYLRPGVGEHFVATGAIMRVGNKVAVTEMKLHNEEGKLIAAGRGAYMVS